MPKLGCGHLCYSNSSTKLLIASFSGFRLDGFQVLYLTSGKPINILDSVGSSSFPAYLNRVTNHYLI